LAPRVLRALQVVMSVEIFLVKKNCYASAVVLDVVGKGKCKCKLNISGEELTIDNTHINLPGNYDEENFRPKQGEIVEVRSDSEEEPGGDRQGQHSCWWVATIASAKGDFYKVNYQGWDKRFDEIVEADRLRPHSSSKRFPTSIEKHVVEVPESLSDWVQNPENLRSHIKDKCGAWGLALAHGSSKGKKGSKKGSDLQLVLLGEKSSSQKAEMLLKLHAKHQVGLRGLKKEAADLHDTLESERQKRGNSIVEEFSIDKDLIGMVVGKGGSNIRNAEKESGVHSAVVEAGRVTIHGPDKESVEMCRAMLEMVKEDVPVSNDQLGWIIGKKGANIRELMSETSVSRAEVDKMANPPSMSLIGTRESVEQAKLWLQCHMDYLGEIEHAEEDLDTIRRELDTTSLGGGRGGRGGKGKGGKGGKGDDRRGDDRRGDDRRGGGKGDDRRGGGKGDERKGGGKGGNRRDEDYPAPVARNVSTGAPAPKPKPGGDKPAPAPKPKPSPKPKGGGDSGALPKPLDDGAKPQRDRKKNNNMKN